MPSMPRSKRSGRNGLRESSRKEAPGELPRAPSFPAVGMALRACRWLIDAVLVVALALISAVLITQVFMRYVLHAALPWPEELSQFLLVLLTMLGACRALEKDMHLRLQVLDNCRWPWLVAPLRIAGYACACAFMAYVAYGGWTLAARSMTVPSTALRLPMGVVYATLPIAFGIMTVILLIVIVRLARGRDAVLDAER